MEASIGRIGITIGALPVILPVNFVFGEGRIRIRTVKGTKLATATANAVVAFEVDSYDSDSRTGWSVLAQGVATEVTRTDIRDQVLAAICDPVGVEEAADRIVEINIESISGRRYRPVDPAACWVNDGERPGTEP